jgi:eukaryotic-like serine/threonine-protein kinase
MTDTKAPRPDAEPPSANERARGAGTPPSVVNTAQPSSGVPRAQPPREPIASRAAPHSMADLLLGTVVADRYKLLERIGEGAMGWVFLAEHTEIGKKVAVKVLRPSLCRLPEAVSRFRREARAATQIGSKHIVDVTDFGTTSTGAVFFVMERLEGGEDLGTALKNSGRMPWPRVRNIVLQLCEALQAAHDAGIFHRDVKPANFFRMEHGGNPDFIKVLDFGIARLATPDDSIVTQTGVIMGTPDFMAPEQAQGRHVDHRADIYSLGATAYALLTGRAPFVGANEYEVIYKQLNEDPVPPSELAPDAGIPSWVNDAILKAMHKNPDERYASMAEFARTLESPPPDEGVAKAAARRDVGTEEAAKKPRKTQRPTSPPRISPVLLVSGALVLAILGALGYVLVFGR